MGHNPVMTNWLRVVTIHGGLVLAGVLLFHDWLDMPSGQSLPAHFRGLAVLQVLLLLIGGWMIRSSHKTESDESVPFRWKSLWVIGVLLLLLLLGIASSLPGLTLVGVGLATLHGSLEILGFVLGRLKRGGAAMLLLLLLVPICLGALALHSPRALKDTGDPLTGLDALFTAVSAVTVTGLSVIDVGSRLSSEGQWILLLLIQIGGLGAVSLFLLFMSFIGEGLGLRQGKAVREAMDNFNLKEMKSLVGSIFFWTLVFETLGVLFLAFNREDQVLRWSPAFDHLFHSVSAFCNSGFSLYSDSLASMDKLDVTVLCLLIMAGGLGFPVFLNLWNRLIGQTRRLETHVYLSLGTSLMLWIGGAALLWIGSEGIQSLFWSVTARTAGFSLASVTTLSDFSLLVLIVLMLIGASPGSTAGGLKTSTLGVLFISLFQQVLGRKQVHFMKRTLSATLLRSAMVLTVLYLSAWILLMSFLHLTERESLETGVLTQQDLVFETASALGTVGLSLDATSQISPAGLWVIMAGMVLGRIGPLAIIVILASLKRSSSVAERPDARVMLG